LAGVEGSLRYRPGQFQYDQSEMWGHVFRLVPGLFSNKMRFGRFLDIFVSHAPPEGIHDMPDLPHQGIKAFRWLLKVFKPVYHFHGHVHIYRPETVSRSKFMETQVINSYGFVETNIEYNQKSR
jgi:Icc-related predicted phosphoesterase